MHDQNESRWQSDIPLALANLALARELAGRPLTTKAALEVLKRTSIRVPPELAKRQALQNAGLFCPVSTATAGGQWDLTAEGAECLRDSGRVPSLTPEAIHAILARHQRPTP